jgi:hypothetical protein
MFKHWGRFEEDKKVLIKSLKVRNILRTNKNQSCSLLFFGQYPKEQVHGTEEATRPPNDNESINTNSPKRTAIVKHQPQKQQENCDLIDTSSRCSKIRKQLVAVSNTYVRVNNNR